jgi:hypothetical protein
MTSLIVESAILVENPNDLDAFDQAIRINELRHRDEELAGGEMTTYESDEAPPGWRGAQ